MPAAFRQTAFWLACLALASPLEAARVLGVVDPTGTTSSFENFWATLRGTLRSGASLQEITERLTCGLPSVWLRGRGREPARVGAGVAEPTRGSRPHRLLCDRDKAYVLENTPSIMLGLTSCPTIAELPAELSPQALAKRVEAGTDVLLVVPPSATETWRDYAREFEIDFDDREQFVADHFSFHPELDSGSHTVLTVPVGSIPSPFVSAATRSGPAVVYRGAGHAAGLHPLLTTLLKAPTTAISAASGSDAPTDEARLAGQQLALVSAFQARNNARVTFSGSADLFSDEFLEPPTVSSAK